jgi:uncharacterized membrane-anchored protein YhcB (DUF1043 family)
MQDNTEASTSSLSKIEKELDELYDMRDRDKTEVSNLIKWGNELLKKLRKCLNQMINRHWATPNSN